MFEERFTVILLNNHDGSGEQLDSDEKVISRDKNRFM